MKTFDDPAAIPPKLDLRKVPAEFHSLTPLAEKYGIDDDIYREQMVGSLTKEERAELIEFLEVWDDRLDTWLAGPEADSRSPSDEYCTFACLRMAADIAKSRTPNKSVVATADNAASSLRSGRSISAVPHFKRSSVEIDMNHRDDLLVADLSGFLRALEWVNAKCDNGFTFRVN